MSQYIKTYTGKHFWPLKAEPEKLCIDDIAHALSLLCRGNGHVSSFFSVGQHCIYCAKEAAERGYSGKVVLACLLHDASECYLSDIPRPIKQVLPDYVQIEENLLSVIYTTFLGEDLTEEEKALVKEVDDDLLYYDLRELLGEKNLGPAPQIHIQINYSFVPFQEVEQEYLSLYATYQGRQEKVALSLDLLVKALGEATEGFDYFVSIYTGEVRQVPRISNVMLAPTEEEEEIRNLASSTGEYILLPGVEEIKEADIMDAFTEELPNPRDAVYLRANLKKVHPKRHFRAALEETGHMGAYREFLKETLRDRMKLWCEEHKLDWK